MKLSANNCMRRRESMYSLEMQTALGLLQYVELFTYLLHNRKQET